MEYNQQAGAETPEQPEVPVCAVHVWGWWWELNARRLPGFDSLTPITYSEIASWLALTGKWAAPEEIDWLVAMDNAWLHAIAEERKAKQDRDKEEAERKQQKRKR